MNGMKAKGLILHVTNKAARAGSIVFGDTTVTVPAGEERLIGPFESWPSHQVRGDMTAEGVRPPH